MHTVARETEGDEGLAVAVPPLFLVAEVDRKEAQHRLRVQWVAVHRGKVYVAWATLIVTIDLDPLKGAVWAFALLAFATVTNRPPFALRLARANTCQTTDPALAMRTNDSFPSYTHFPLNVGLASIQPGWSPRMMTLPAELSQRPEWISAALSAVNKRMPLVSTSDCWQPPGLLLQPLLAPIPPIPKNRVPTRRKTKLCAMDETPMMRRASS